MGLLRRKKSPISAIRSPQPWEREDEAGPADEVLVVQVEDLVAQGEVLVASEVVLPVKEESPEKEVPEDRVVKGRGRMARPPEMERMVRKTKTMADRLSKSRRNSASPRKSSARSSSKFGPPGLENSRRKRSGRPIGRSCRKGWVFRPNGSTKSWTSIAPEAKRGRARHHPGTAKSHQNRTEFAEEKSDLKRPVFRRDRSPDLSDTCSSHSFITTVKDGFFI